MICDECGTKEALDAMGLTEGSSVRKSILHVLAEALHRRRELEQMCRQPVISGQWRTLEIHIIKIWRSL